MDVQRAAGRFDWSYQLLAGDRSRELNAIADLRRESDHAGQRPGQQHGFHQRGYVRSERGKQQLNPEHENRSMKTA